MPWLESLRQKPDRDKKMIAFGIALGLTLVIGAMWIVGTYYVKM